MHHQRSQDLIFTERYNVFRLQWEHNHQLAYDLLNFRDSRIKKCCKVIDDLGILIKKKNELLKPRKIKNPLELMGLVEVLPPVLLRMAMEYNS